MELFNEILVTQRFELYILYLDEKTGKVPLFNYPLNESQVYNEIYNEKFYPILTHPIWHLETKKVLKHNFIDFSYEKYIYLGRRYLIHPRRKTRTDGKEKYFDILVVIASIPKEIYKYSIPFLDSLIEHIMINYDSKFGNIIKAEIAKEEPTKTSETIELIDQGKSLIQELRTIIHNFCKEYIALLTLMPETKIKFFNMDMFPPLKGL